MMSLYLGPNESKASAGASVQISAYLQGNLRRGGVRVTRAVISYFARKQARGGFSRAAGQRRSAANHLLDSVFCEVVAEGALADAHHIGGFLFYAARTVERA